MFYTQVCSFLLNYCFCFILRDFRSRFNRSYYNLFEFRLIVNFICRYLGWRINVLDSCDLDGEGSEIDEAFADPDGEGFEAQASIRHESKINPNSFVLDEDKDVVKIYAQPSDPLNDAKDSDISKLITDGIRAAEELEQSILDRERNKFNQTLSLNLEESMAPQYSDHHSQKGIPVPFDTPQAQHQTSGLPMFLRPPLTFPKGPILRPVKLSYRRPVSYDRRPIHHRPQRPVISPQQSVIISHYKKPVSSLVRTFTKNKQPPIQSIASVLLLGEPTEISSQRFSTPPPVHIQKPSNSHIVDFQSYKNNKDIPLLFPQQDKPSGIIPQYYEKPVLQKTSSKILYEKKPFEYRTPDFSKRPSTSFGFQPDSVVVESGFRPIIRRDDTEETELDNKNRRRDDVSDEEDESIIDDSAAYINREPDKKTFEPMFIPSPLDNVNIGGKMSKNNKKEHLSGDLIDMEVEDGDDKIAVAAERQDTYYLPPFNKRPGQVYPEGTVVAYDGKAVLDASLVNPGPQSIGSQIYADVSRTEQLIRETPQFAPFRGEIPPLGSEYSQQNGVQFQMSREPNPVTEYFNPLSHPRNPDPNSRPISTKLTLHRSDSSNTRTKRAAAPHHTPDHHGDGHDLEHYDQNHMHNKTTSKAALNYHYFSHLAFISSIAMMLLFRY